jgi:4-hydroxyphenylpyruvate dioxygenase-like putative hemolysin
MPDEEVYLIGGWNNQILSIYDAQSDNYFEEIMEIQVGNVDHIAHMMYVDELKFLIIGGFQSTLSVFR